MGVTMGYGGWEIRSPVLVKWHSENEPYSRFDTVHTMFHRLETVDIANPDQAVPRAEQYRIA